MDNIEENANQKLDLQRLVKMLDAHTFNDGQLIAVTISPFKQGNIMEVKADNRFNRSTKNMFTFMVIVSGSIELSLDYMKFRFERSQWVEIRPSASFELLNISNDFMAYMIMASETFIMDTLLDKKPIPVSHFVDMKESPALALNEEELTALKYSLDRIIYYIKQENHNFKKDMLHNTFYNLILEASNIFTNRDKDRKQGQNLSRRENILRQFMFMIDKYAKKEHNPSFYSDKLCISTQYLSIILKDITGKTANHWIAKKLITESKTLLRTPGKTIKEITDELHFADQSSFGKFFKKHTGISPKKYREDFSSPQ